jgi:GTP:adenosylcobinamide-phosphate guanylyltransferase
MNHKSCISDNKLSTDFLKIVDAIILAGGGSGGEFAEKYPALLNIGGKPMVSHVADALFQNKNVRNIYVAGPVERLAGCPLPSSAIIIKSKESLIETIKTAMSALGHEEKTLVATADIPLLTKESVDGFLDLCGKRQADFYYPVISKKNYEAAFPGASRTYVRLKEGVFTGGNLFLADPKIVGGCAEIAEKIIKNRKSPLKLCRMLGLSFLLKFAFGRLSMMDAQMRANKILNIKGVVLDVPFPEIGADVDKKADFEFVQKEFMKRGGMV